MYVKLLHFRSDSLEISFLQQTSDCKFSLGNTTEEAELSKSYLDDNLSYIRSRVSQKNVTFNSVLQNYESDVLRYVIKGMDYDWEKTEDHKLWKGLRSHKALLDVLQTSCELKHYLFHILF